jgi:hypothetical protein
VRRERPRITFGVIVLNGEPFTRYCLRSLYPFAHEIIVVEGGSRHASPSCTEDGHSIDGTLDVLRRFKEEEDPQDRLRIVTRGGFWGEKTEQSQAYAERATGDWLWQVDIDEFYRPESMARFLAHLGRRGGVGMASFEQVRFWGAPDIRVRSLRDPAGAGSYDRLFRWGPGHRYVEHRPPTVLDAEGTDLRARGWLRHRETKELGIQLYHYAQLFPSQMRRKSQYYESLSGGRRQDAQWTEDCYLRLSMPFRVHNVHSHMSWLEPFDGQHPPEVVNMLDDVRRGHLHVELRDNRDAYRLLRSPGYAVRRGLLRAVAPLYGTTLGWYRRHSTRSALGGRRPTSDGGPPG